ncbi:MAG: DUF5655 domain-containing protein [Cyclobacteriaceae bacterium]
MAANFTELDHLQGKDEIVRKIYRKLIDKLSKFGQLKIEPKKTSVHLRNRLGFAGVYTRRSYLNLEVHLNYELKTPRISKIERASANRYHLTIKLTKDSEVDKELLGWLREAYNLKK